MNNHPLTSVLIYMLLGAGFTSAQAAPRSGCYQSASAPAMDCPPMGSGTQWGSDYTHGWSLMTRAEQEQHRNSIRAMKTFEECRAYMEKHHSQMLVRAQEKGRTLPGQPRIESCAGLQLAKK